MLDWLFTKPLSVGEAAPDFSAPGFTLSALRGKNVVLVFYPADGTSVCTRQLCEFRDAWDEVKAKNAVVYGVNPAHSKRHEFFRAKQRLPFPLLVDKGQKIARLFHSKGLVVPRRTVYLIGPDGVIRYARRGKPVPAEVLAAAVTH
jgi:peroxiredoxin Q/BCP